MQPAFSLFRFKALRSMPSLVALNLLFASIAFTALAEPSTASGDLELALAKRLLAHGEAEAARLAAPGGAIAIVDAGGHLVLLERMDGTFPAAAAVSTEKARTAALFRQPTENFENAIKSGRHALLGVDLMTPLQGGVPIKVGGRIVGAVGVSGAASADQDNAIAKAIAQAAEGAAK